MNNSCPNCQAIYKVAMKDVGRRIKCKECGAPLYVSELGLQLEQPKPAPSSVEEDDFSDADEVQPKSRYRKQAKAKSSNSFDILGLFKNLGGVPTLLFGFGAFLVIVFLFQPIIGAAAIQRAKGAADRIDLDWRVQEKKMLKEKKSQEDINNAREKYFKEYDKDRADEGVSYETISNQRGRWMEMYGMMFGFLFLMAGSIGFMMPDQSNIRRIVGAIVLTAQMLIIFLVFAVSGRN